ncbi:hypothetical protein [Hyalangium gracile]|uniref:hypothetical protein n=1 Tax=Hyalangium gracile TaxID=394092 RepID=UPI001CCAD37C|nr:hypothetical protein [Hyalangium gracile]
MKLSTALCFLVFAGCATASQHAVTAQESSLQGENGSEQMADPVRLETPAGTFLVNPEHADDFQRLLAGEPSTKPFYAADVIE